MPPVEKIFFLLPICLDLNFGRNYFRTNLVVEQNVDAISDEAKNLLTVEISQSYKAQLFVSASLSWDKLVKQMAKIFYSWK